MKVIRVPFHDILSFADAMARRMGPAADAKPVEGESGRGHIEVKDGNGVRSSIRKVLRWIKLWAAFPDPYIFWFPGAFVRGMLELRKKRYHAVFSTSPPNTCHLLGAALGHRDG